MDNFDLKKYLTEENVIKDLAQADEVIKIIKMMNPDVREDLLKRIARMGQKLNENQDDSYYIDEIKRDLEELDDKEANEYLEDLAKSILKLKR